jgi:IS30 family transposase
MGKRYSQLGLEERFEIARLRTAGSSIRQIASALDRQPSTIAREIKRNESRQSGYRPVYAEEQSRARRWTGSKLDRDGELREKVLGLLGRGWSPEQVSASLNRERGFQVISYETIYRFVYAQMARTTDYAWRHYLPRGKSKRGRYGKRGGGSASFIALRCPISERPQAASDRRSPGHWEADLMLFSKYGQALLFLHERYTRLLLAVRPPCKEAYIIARAIKEILAPLPHTWRQTVTFDNGTEFACHYELHDIDTETYFCDAYAPWQKGGIENAIGRMRRSLPRKTDLATLSDERFAQFIQRYNNTPRKCLDYRTPAEVFWQKLLHFKCESTPSFARG